MLKEFAFIKAGNFALLDKLEMRWQEQRQPQLQGTEEENVKEDM
jgi:hypothetical protein